MSKGQELSGYFHKGRPLTNEEVDAIKAQAEANGQEVVVRSELGKQRAPSRWIKLGNGWEGRLASR